MTLDHIAVNVENISQAVDWYCSNLSDVCVLHMDDTWAMLEAGGAKIALTVPNQHKPHIAFRVDDPPEGFSTHRDGSKFVYLSDPWGNVIEMIYYSEDK